MKKIVILSFCVLFLTGCGNEAQQTKIEQSSNTNVTTTPPKRDDSLTVSSHSQDKPATAYETNSTPVPKSETKTKWTQSGSPIDTTAFDAEIKQAENKLKTNPKDENLKKALAAALVKRGVALTDARQYASALGDYRRALKYDAGNEIAKNWIDEIVGIYDMLNKDYPKEGEEPPPLPYKKES